jgi:mevalonate kinase
MTSAIIQARAPGKIILMGEHAVLHGCPAIATSLGLYCNIQVRAREDMQIALQLPDLNLHRYYAFQTLLDYAGCARQSGAQAFTYAEGADADHLVKCAIGEFLLRLAPEDWRGFSLRVESSIPSRAGFGSSGALAISLAAALLRFFNLKPQQHPLEPLAMNIERYQHGQPSGIDHNTSLLGSTVERRPMEDGSFKLISWPKSAAWLQLRDVEIYDTGAARESTGHIIAATRHRLEGPDNPLLESMRHSAERFRTLLQRPVPMPETLKQLLRDYEDALECLGVVPSKIAKVIRAIERAGGAAKICGAGALSGDQAGALLVIGAPARPELAQFRRIHAPLAVDGLQVSEG